MRQTGNDDAREPSHARTLLANEDRVTGMHCHRNAYLTVSALLFRASRLLAAAQAPGP